MATSHWAQATTLRSIPDPIRVAVCIACFLGCLAAVLQAGDDPQASEENPAALKNLSLEELSQIEVTTPSKEPVQAFRSPSAVYVITGDDIRRSGATSIPEALRLAPGVEVARIDSSKWSIGIRGFGSRLNRSVLVLMDGRTVYTTLFDGTYWEVQNTDLDDVDRIEVIRGPGGTIWGPNAVDGVIDIITKSAADTQGLLVSAGGGTVDQGSLNARYGGGNGGGLHYRVYGMGFSRGPEDHFGGDDFDDWRQVQAGFRMDWNRDPRNTFTVQGDLYQEVQGEAVQATSYTAPYSQVIAGNASLSGGNILGRWKKVFSGGNDFQLQVYFDRTNRFEPNLADIRSTFDADFLDRFRLPWRQEISWGIEGRVQPIHDPAVVSGLQFLPVHRTDYLVSGFLQDEIGLVDRRLSLTVGSKVLGTNFTHGVDLEPSARLLWTLDDTRSFWAAFTHAVRTPSDSEENFYLLGYIQTLPNGTPYFARFNPNSNFSPEQLNGYEFGCRQIAGRNLYVDLATFYNHYHDLFSEDLEGTPFFEATPPPPHELLPAEFRNGLLGYTKGVEIAPEWKPAAFFRLRGSYSYLHMNIGRAPHSGDVGTAPGIVGSSPQHQVTFEPAFDISKTIQLGVTYRYVSALPGQSVPAYSTADARIGWQVARMFQLSLVGSNLFQPSHFEYGSDPLGLVGIRRSVYAKITWSR